MHARPDSFLGLKKDLGQILNLLKGETRGIGLNFGLLLRGEFDQVVSIRDDLRDQHIPRIFHQFATKLPQVAATILHLGERSQCPRGILIPDRPKHGMQQFAGDRPEQRHQLIARHFFSAEGDRLIQKAQRIPHAAIRRPRERAQAALINSDPLGLCHSLQLVHHFTPRDPAEGEVLAPGQNRLGNLV